MIMRRTLLAGTAASIVAGRLPAATAGAAEHETFPVAMSDDAWRRRLTPAQFDVLRRSGTERPFTSPLLHEARRGTFACMGCAEGLFASTTKFDSGTGWPSFWAPLEGAVGAVTDSSFGMARTAVHCARCGGHLGHVFNDGPKPTGLRYCINGVALQFREDPAQTSRSST